MKIHVHIGPDGPSSDRLQRVLDAKRDQMRAKGVLYAQSPGARNHSRLFMAVSDPGAVDALRFNRGYIAPEKQAVLRADVARKLHEEVALARPEVLILSAHQLGNALSTHSEIARLRALLLPLSDDIEIVAHLDDPARMLLRRYAVQLMDGRGRSPALELGLLHAPSFWEAALATQPECDPQTGQFPDTQGANFWLDFRRLQSEWEAVFGLGRVRFHSLDPARLYGEDATGILRDSFGLSAIMGKAIPGAPPPAPSAAWTTRCRMLNEAILRLLAHRNAILPRQLWRKFLGEIKVHGDPIAPGTLHALSARFATDIATLCAQHPGLIPARMAPDPARPDWSEADPTLGFRATQYLMAFRWRINQATKAELAPKAGDLAQLELGSTVAPSSTTPGPAALAGQPMPAATGPKLSPCAEQHLPPLAKQTFAKLAKSPFAPHNRMGQIDEEAPAPAFAPIAPRILPEESSGNVILGCMKNEAPYILEWVAYHRAMGVDTFLIYTNGCEDGTTEILDRLQQMGVLHHRDNNAWTGNSPQQHALDAALKEPVVTQADWLIHIDVDEFINVRCGNGTLQDLFDRVPEATNIAMTWRLFGHNGVSRLSESFVVDQFDTCAPKFCPKPHTAWGFKTMVRNIGAYQKISCHRPNKLIAEAEAQIRWVNGSGRDMTKEAIKNGWRSSRKTIGYDLVQLNHYALRSAESFLIKRQRGRALHVDRSIGLNYWVRMDWSGRRDITIKRNIPRLRAEYDRLLADPVLRKWHDAGMAWHRAKAQDLHRTPEFADLYQQALSLRLSETERVAFALALDLES